MISLLKSICWYCGKEFDASRKNIHFCCQVHRQAHKCKRYAMKKNYKKVNRYNSKILKNKCQICGYNRLPQILHVHHIDRNTSNNNIENLLVVCPTCHAEVHFGGYKGPLSSEELVDRVMKYL